MTKPISMDKQYRTRDGRNVRILCVDRKANANYPVIALVDVGDDDDDLAIYTADGSFFGNGEQHRLDLIEVSQWDFPIDTPVLVRDQDGESWIKRHFAGVSKKGYPTTFCGGCTSFTADECSGTVSWNQCIKADV